MHKFMRRKYKDADQLPLVANLDSKNIKERRTKSLLLPPIDEHPMPDEYIQENSTPRTLEVSDRNNTTVDEDVEPTGGESDQGSSSGYQTLPKECHDPTPPLYKAYSVPDLHSKSQLAEEAKFLRPNTSYITYNINDSREFILSPNGGSTINKTSPNTDGSDTSSSKQERHIAGRGENILQHLDGVHDIIETELFKGGQAVLDDPSLNSLLILKGSGSGCNFAAKMLYRKFLKENRDAIGYCLKDPNEWCYIEPDKKAVVLVLRANGSNEQDKNLLNSWYNNIAECKPIGSNINHNLTIIVTVRDYKHDGMKAHRFLEEYSQHVVDASEQKYRGTTKTIRDLTRSIALQHNVHITQTKKFEGHGNRRIVEKYIIDCIPAIVGKIGHIRKLNRFFGKYLKDGLEFFRRPDPLIVRQMREYANNRPKLFLALLAVHAHGGKLGVGRLNQMEQMHSYKGQFFQSMQNITKMSHFSKVEHRFKDDFPEGVIMYKFARKHGLLANLAKNLQVYAKHLEGTYLEEYERAYQFSNGHAFFSFLVVLCEIFPKAIETCDGEFFFNYIKPTDELVENDECLIVDIRKSKEITKSLMVRFKEEFMQRHVAKCMTHPVIYPDVLQKFLQFLDSNSTWEVLCQQDIDSTEPYTCLFYGLQNYCTRVGTDRNNTDVIIDHGMWAKKRKKQKWRECTRLHEKETILKAVELHITSTFKRLIRMGVEIPVAALERAIHFQYTDIMSCILENASFTDTEWYDEVTHAISVMSTKSNCQEKFVELVYLMLSKVEVQRGVEKLSPLLFHAVRTNNLKVIRTLFEKNFMPSCAIDHMFEGNTALREASRRGYTSIVAYLFQRLTDQEQTEASETHTTEFCINDLPEFLNGLLQRQPCIVHEKGNGLTLLFSAVTEGRLDIVECIIKTYEEQISADPDETQQKYFQSDENVSAQGKCSSCNQWFPLNPLSFRNNEGQTVLHIAAEMGHDRLASLFVRKGLNIRAKNNDGDTPLTLACRTKNIGVLQLVLNEWKIRGYPIDERVVLRAVQENEVRVVNTLIHGGFGVNFVNNTYGVPLIIATQYKLSNMMRCLLNNDADPNITHDGFAPIHVTAKNGDIEGYKILKKFGANVLKTQGCLKQTVIHIAAQNFETDYIDNVLHDITCRFESETKGSNETDTIFLINKQDAQCETALHIAARLGCSPTVEVLLRYGFDSEIRNKSGYLPSECAIEGRAIALQKEDEASVNAFDSIISMLSQPQMKYMFM